MDRGQADQRVGGGAFEGARGVEHDQPGADRGDRDRRNGGARDLEAAAHTAKSKAAIGSSAGPAPML